MTWIFGSFLVTPCAVRLWLVNRGMTARHGNRVQHVRPRDENHAGKFRGRESGVKLGTCSRAETPRLERGCKRWPPLAPRKRYGTRRLLSEYMSLHLSLKLITNCGPLFRIKWEIYFYKEVFRSFIEFRKSCLIEHTTLLGECRSVSRHFWNQRRVWVLTLRLDPP